MPSQPVLHVDNLTWKPSGALSPVLRQIKLQLFAGESLAIVGPSGCGKSSLLRCLVLLERFSTGRIVWQGKDVRPQNILQYRRTVAYVAQQPVAICPTVTEELAFARQADGLGEDQQIQLLQRLGLDVGQLDKPLRQFSLGEQQRIALVRSLSPNPEVLLLDEPTSALDDVNEQRLEQVVSDYLAEQPQRAAIWVSHKAGQRDRMCSRQLFLERG